MKTIKLLIDGEWRAGTGPRIPVLNPATGQPIAEIAGAAKSDLDAALDAAARGFALWRDVSAYDRCKVLRKAADLLRTRSDAVAEAMSEEQGKPVAQAKNELVLSADTIDFFAEEGRRTFGKLIPGRTPGQQLMSLREPIGPVAAFTPWNFPILQAVRKVSPALAAGCSVILKAPEDTPTSGAMLAQIFLDAGLPAPVLSLVYGDPPEISEYLIPHKVIRKVSFTGSTAVGKHLAAMAGAHMKRITMELGGHAPAIVFDDANPVDALKLISGAKYVNAGQVCISPTRIMVHDRHFDQFVEGFTAAAEAVKVGPATDPTSTMGPLVNQKRLDDVSAIVNEAVSDGATLRTGGNRIGNEGFFFAPTVLTDVPIEARIMNDEPFGPVALINRFSDDEQVMAEMNRLDYGLATYAYTRDADRIQRLSRRAETGMLAINSQSVSFVEAPFGGVKDSGYGSESGSEAMDSYLNVKQVNVNL